MKEKPTKIASKKIIRVIKQSLVQSSEEAHERDYVIIRGKLHFRRVIEADNLQLAMTEKISKRRLELKSIKEAEGWTTKISRPGQVESIEFVREHRVSDELGPKEVEVKVEAVGLIPFDSLKTSGIVLGEDLGSQCAGTICRVGDEVSLNRGDRVCVLGSDLCRSHVRTMANRVAACPSGITFEQASVLPYDYWLASYILNSIAHLTATDSVMIHPGAISISQACISFSQELGATVFVTAATEQEHAMLIDQFLLPEGQVLSSSYTSDELSFVTAGQGIDVILNLSGGLEILDALDCVKTFGRFIQLKTPGAKISSANPFPDFQSNMTFSTVDPVSLLQSEYFPMERPFQDLISSAANKMHHASRDVPIYSVVDIERGLVKLRESDEQNVVIRMDSDSRILVRSEVKPTYSFDCNGTYVINGGLGGLGRFLARWMVGRGARNLVLLSRSGPRTTAARHLIEELGAQGVRVVTPLCDSADAECLRMTIRQCTNRMPVIKGCIQTSAVLRDTLFEKMSFDDWKASTRPKVEASWNLHNVLPEGMDFFIMTSSVSGVLGQVTQSNYAAGNTYQDALARYRVSKGEKAVSLDLGVLLTEGLLTDNPQLLDRTTRSGSFVPISEPQILALFDYYCDPALPLLQPLDSQLIIGIKSPANIKAEGHDLPAAMNQPLWQSLSRAHQTTNRSIQNGEKAVDLTSLIANAPSTAEAGATAAEALSKRLTRMLSISDGELDMSMPIHRYGVDSLTAVDLRNWISRTFDVDVPMFDLSDSSVDQVGKVIASKVIERSKA